VLEVGDRRRDRLAGRVAVVVEHADVAAPRDFEAVVSAGHALVLGQTNEANRAELFCDRLGAAVVGRVVDHDRLPRPL